MVLLDLTMATTVLGFPASTAECVRLFSFFGKASSSLSTVMHLKVKQKLKAQCNKKRGEGGTQEMKLMVQCTNMTAGPTVSPQSL